MFSSFQVGRLFVRRPLLLAFLLIASGGGYFGLLESGSSAVFAQEPKNGWVDLFPNSSLGDWQRTNTPPETWSFEDGMLVCSGKPIGEIRTRRMYQNFVLELEWRHMVPGGNAGVFVWADDITAKGVPFHRGIEVQVLENSYGNTQSHTTHGDIFPIHGAKMVPINGRGGSRAFPTENLSKPSPNWNHYRVECRDGEISLAVNGKVVTRGQECWPKRGYICLESEGGVVHYRNVRIMELPDTEIQPTEIAIENRGYESIYSGLDLRGWRAEGVGSWKPRDWVLSYVGPSDGTGELISELKKPLSGFLFDFKLKDAKSRVAIDGLWGTRLDLGKDQIAAAMSPVGQWNRIELSKENARVLLAVNGRKINLPALNSADMESQLGELILEATGEIDFANLYQKPASISER